MGVHLVPSSSNYGCHVKHKGSVSFINVHNSPMAITINMIYICNLNMNLINLSCILINIIKYF